MAKGRYHWSNAAPAAKFFKINAVAAVPILLLFLYPSMTLLYVTLGIVGFLIWVELIKKMSLRAFLRSVNILITGRVKASINNIKEFKR